MCAKFGLVIEPYFGFEYRSVEQIALLAERVGYESFWASDHFYLDSKSEDRNCMEVWMLMAALASRTRNLRLGTLVTCNSYRYPPVLAKMAATVDHIPNGRLFFGIGDGWKKDEYRAYGIPFPQSKHVWTSWKKPSRSSDYYGRNPRRPSLENTTGLMRRSLHLNRSKSRCHRS